jgi:TPR repeat protein
MMAGAAALAPAWAPAFARDASFAELLAKAEAQAAAGHRWSPPGDNMTETVAGMMDLISSATPQQLAELSALLEKDGNSPAQEAASGQPRLAPAPPPAAQASPPSQASPPVRAQPSEPARLETSPPPRAQPAPPPAAIEPKRPAGAGAKAPAQPNARTIELLTRGKEAERLGDVSGARRFYASAASQGNATAALSLGRLYDPAYLKQTALGGIDPDPAQARQWYERALALGNSEAGPLLEALSLR